MSHETYDIRVFDRIESQTTDGDRESLLFLKELVASAGTYAYLEIGSHLGGSLQPHLLDERCTAVISIDRRPASQPDKRLSDGQRHVYEGNSTARMRSLLAQLPGADLTKLTTIDADTQAIDPESITERPALCFIDGEHTDLAALRDALFCAAVAPRSIIAFHDRGAVGRGISAFMRVRGGYGNPLPDTIWSVDLGGRRRLDKAQRRPWLWHAANAVGLAGEGAALTPLLWSAARALRRRGS